MKRERKIKLIDNQIVKKTVLNFVFEKAAWIFKILGLNQEEVKNLVNQWYIEFPLNTTVFLSPGYEFAVCFPIFLQADIHYYAVVSYSEETRDPSEKLEITKITVIQTPDDDWFKNGDLNAFLNYMDTQKVATYSRTAPENNSREELLLIRNPNDKGKHPGVQHLITLLQKT